MSLYGNGQQQIGTYADPFVLPGSQIEGLTDNMTALAARAHRQSVNGETLCELYFWRDGAWSALPEPPLMDAAAHPVLTRAYREPATLEFTLKDEDGLLAPTNLESPYNFDMSGDVPFSGAPAGYDPLLDEARKVLFRVGTRCWGNLAAGIAPSASLPPTSGTLALLTDGFFAVWNRTPVAAGSYAAWNLAAGTPLTLTLDLGSVQPVRHLAARFGTLVGNWTLPAAVQAQLSQDGVTWQSWPPRPVGGAGSATLLPGDWADAISTAPTTTEQNLLANAGFETQGATQYQFPPWTNGNGASSVGNAGTGDPVHSGYNCVALNPAGGGIAQAVGYTAGPPLSSSCWFALQAGGGTAATVQLVIELLDGSGNLLHSLSGPQIALAPDNVYRQFRLDWPTPPVDANVAQARARYLCLNYTNQEPLIDDCALYVTTTQIQTQLDPCVTEVFLCDLDQQARYVRVGITPVGSQTIALDEIAVYGGAASGFAGKNLFCGYLGDGIDLTPDGTIVCIATGVEKKLADNNETRLTSRFGNVDLSQVAYSLLTGATYWRGAPGAYDAPWQPSELAWGATDALTGLLLPLWQGQGNNHLGYQYELWHEVGWILYGDGNGVLQPYEPPYRQWRPDRVLIADPDGNQDVRAIRRTLTGKDLRNVCEVATGAARSGGSLVLTEPSSVGRYGHRRNIITDPIAYTPDIRQKVAAQVLRDYAWKLASLQCVIAPDYDTQLRCIHGLRASLRPAIYSLSCAVAGQRRLGELWRLMRITEHFTAGSWWGEAEYAAYVPQAIVPPVLTTLTPNASSPYSMTVVWEPDNDPGLTGFNVYVSAVSGTAGFALQNPNGPIPASSTSYVFAAGNIAGAQFWVYVTAVDSGGHESEPSAILTALAGGGASDGSGWTVTDLAASFDDETGPDSQGYTTYQISFLWTSPPLPTPAQDQPCCMGFKHALFGFAVGSVPANPLDVNAWHYFPGNEIDVNRVPPGMTGSGTNTFAPPFTPGQLSWQARFRVAAPIPSGTTLYWRIRTSNTTLGWGNTYWSNICSCTIL